MMSDNTEPLKPCLNNEHDKAWCHYMVRENLVPWICRKCKTYGEKRMGYMTLCDKDGARDFSKLLGELNTRTQPTEGKE